jgi:hypothetical protein
MPVHTESERRKKSVKRGPKGRIVKVKRPKPRKKK